MYDRPRSSSSESFEGGYGWPSASQDSFDGSFINESPVKNMRKGIHPTPPLPSPVKHRIE